MLLLGLNIDARIAKVIAMSIVSGQFLINAALDVQMKAPAKPMRAKLETRPSISPWRVDRLHAIGHGGVPLDTVDLGRPCRTTGSGRFYRRLRT